MTVIAVFKVDDMPIVIGDLLISSDVKGAAIPIPMPASGVLNVDYEYEHELALLVQKVTKISENLVVAWTGSYFEAQEFIRSLRADVQSLKRTSWRRVKGALNRAGQNVQGSSFGLVYLYCDNKVSTYGGMGSAKPIEAEGVGEIFVAGSGKDALIELLGGYQEEMEFPQHRAVSFLSRLWTLDLNSQQSLQEKFGGGYELAAKDGNGVRKVGDVLLANAFGKLNSDGTGELGVDGRYCKIDYVEDYLCLRVVRHVFDKPHIDNHHTSTAESKAIYRTAYMVPPIDGVVFAVKGQNERLDEVMRDMAAEWTCVHLFAQKPPEKWLSQQFAFHRPKRNSPVEVGADGSVHWQAELIRSVLTELDRFLVES